MSAPIEKALAAVCSVYDARIYECACGCGRDEIRIDNVAPDSEGASTEPGSPWDEECDGILATVKAALPRGWTAEWLDDDIRVFRGPKVAS